AAKPEWKLDGVNLLPYLTGSESRPPHEALYWRFGQQFAIRKGDWKLVKFDAQPPQLYNLADDIGESHDQAAKQPELFRELESAWKRWDAELAKPLWGAGARGNQPPR